MTPKPPWQIDSWQEFAGMCVVIAMLGSCCGYLLGGKP